MARGLNIMWIVSGLLAAAGVGAVVAAEPAGWDGKNPLATEAERHHTPSPVIFPDQRVPLLMLHDKHLAAGLQCTQCHEDAESSTRASDDLLPKGESCDLCHFLTEPNAGALDPKSACTSCHLGYTNPTLPEGVNPHETAIASPPPKAVMPAPNLRFNHKVHVARRIECTTCHEGMDGIQVATRENALPVMGKCLECHDGKTAPSSCSTCHLTTPDERIVQVYETGTLAPSGYYRPDNHAAPDWIRSHEMVAKADERYCESCHTKNECVSCHNGQVRPVKIHPANWILIHPTTARKNSLECTSCHREQSFCITCHQQSRLSDLQPNDNPNIEVHPRGWVNNIIAGDRPGPNHHKWQAQRNIRACVGCHTESTCVKCHSARDVPGFGVTPVFNKINPHPPDFAGRCATMLSMNPGMCAKCHEPGDTAMIRCR